MNILKITISFLIWIFTFLFVLVFTYFTPTKSNIDNFSFENNNQLWLFQLSKEGEKLKFEKTSEQKENVFYKEKLNSLDEILFISDKNYKKTENKNDISLNISNWIFFLDIKDVNKNYKINQNSFYITPKSSWRFLFDTRDEKNIKIFSFDSILEIWLLNWANSEKLTQIVLYPHMSFTFNSDRNILVKNADLLRIETIFSVNYFKKNLKLDSYKDVWEFLYGQNIDKISSDFISSIFENVAQNIKQNNEKSNYIIKTSNIVWIDYITKYFVLFLNDSKKIVYYKNDILKNLNELATWWEKTDYWNTSDSIKEDLFRLKEMSDSDYNDALLLLNYYYENLLNSDNIALVDNIYYLSKIIYDVNNFDSKRYSKASILINKFYSSMDGTNGNNLTLQKNILSYVENFFQENGIWVDENSKSISIKNKDLVYSDLESLSFFLKNILNHNVLFSDNKNILVTLKLLKNYFYINNSLSLINNNKYESFIVENSYLIDKILLEMRKTFFENDLDQNWLLVISKEFIMPKSILNSFNSTIKLFFDFQEKNKNKLSEKNKIYNDFYLKNKRKYSEYYLALENYNEYSIKYNQAKSDLFSTKTVLENWENIILSEENAISYLSSFEWIDLSNTTIKISSDSYYKIDNIFINWERFSFDLYPKELNRIEKIYRNWSLLNISYELDSLKYDYDELYKSAPPEEKDKYDFKKFFINTFFSQNISSNQQFVYEENEPIEEDRSISIFKRDKLVWDKWDFSILKWFLDIWYNDVFVKLQNNSYDIDITNSKLKIKVWESLILWDFSSKYVFNDSSHYFKDVKITLYSTDFDWNRLWQVFWQDTISINKNIDIRNFEKDFSNIISDIMSLSWLDWSIKSIIWVDLVNIMVNDKNITLEFPHKWTTQIVINNWKITAINVSGNNILNNKIIQYTEANKYLQLIK